MTQYVGESGKLAALGMKQRDINQLSDTQKTGILKMLDQMNPGLHKTNNMPAGGRGAPSIGAATKENAWRPTQGQTMMNYYEGYNKRLLDEIDNFVLTDHDWLIQLAEPVDAAEGSLVWSATEFSPKVPSQVPPRSRVRLLDVRRTSGKALLTRKGIGAEFDLETLERGVPRGIEEFIAQINNINLSVVEGLRIDLMWQIITAMMTQPVSINEEFVRGKGMRGLLDNLNEVVFSAVTRGKSHQLWHEHFKDRQLKLGVARPTEAHVYIMHYHTAMNSHYKNKLVQSYQLNGLLANIFQADAAQAWTDIMGEPVYLAREFVNAGGVYDPMLMNSTVAVDYPFCDVSRLWPEHAWGPASNLLTVPDLDIGSTFVISYEQELEACERFDPIDGSALSLEDSPKWAALSPDQAAKIDTSYDQFHPSGSKKAAFVVGSASGFSGKRALQIVDTFLSTRASLYNRLNSLIRRVEDVAGYMGAGSLVGDDGRDLVAAIRDLAANAAVAPASATGLRPVDEALRQLTQDPSVKFVATNQGLTDAANKFEYPPLFDSGGGFRYLSKNSNKPAVQKELTGILDDARDIAAELGAFGLTLAMDPRYSANGVFNTDPAQLLIDAILPMRPLLFVTANAGGGSQVVEAARGFMQALSKYPGIDKLVINAANSDAAYMVLSLIYKFQETHALSTANKNKARMEQIGGDAVRIIAANTGNAAAAADATVQMLEQHTDLKYGELSAQFQQQLAVLKTGGAGGVPSGQAVRTPFRVSPSQLTEIVDNRLAGLSVQRLGAFDQPAQPAELAAYSMSIKNSAADPTARYAQGMPIGRQTMVFGPGSVRIADAAGHALRPMAPGGSALGIGAGAAASSSRTFNTLFAGAADTAARQADAIASAAQEASARAMVGVADSRAAHFVTREYIAAFNAIGSSATSDASAVLARMLLQLPLNKHALAAAYNGGLPPVLSFHNLSLLEATTYPVIRMATGAKSLVWSRTHEHLNWGINAQTGMLGVYLTYYTGVASPEPRRIQGIEGADPVEHKKGMAGRFETGRNFFSPANQGGYMPVAYFTPHGNSRGDHYFSITGDVVLGNSQVSVDTLDLDGSVAAFEMMRTGIAFTAGQSSRPKEVTPPTVLALLTQNSATTTVFSQGTSRFGSDDRHYLESKCPIPTALHNANLKGHLFRVFDETALSKNAGDGK